MSTKTHGKTMIYLNLGLRTLPSSKVALSIVGKGCFQPAWSIFDQNESAKRHGMEPGHGTISTTSDHREFCRLDGSINATILEQKSFHVIASNEYSQSLNRPFKLKSEIYYKDLSQLNTYTVEDANPLPIQ